MKTHSYVSSVPSTDGTRVPSDTLRARLNRLYALAQSSDFLFGSPLGPLGPSELTLPRFVYFGPQTSDVSPRLAVVAGLGRHDLPAARALTAFVERLAEHPEIGHGLNVSFFPVAYVLGHLGGAEEHDLAAESWARSRAPELALLAQDGRLRCYQGYIRVVTTTDDEPAARVRTILSPYAARSEAEVFNSADFGAWSVTFESLAPSAGLAGPLSLAEDLPCAPFEVELALPADWVQAHADANLGLLLKRLITRYRGFIAYGQHL